tara:strand:- start:7 stop:990 length:984 start_codon:yes stop_codon:yes gene_type:complete
MKKMNNKEKIALAREVMLIESDAIRGVADSLDQSFCEACDMILSNKGKLITLGVGKSGHIARKISATLSSTGTSSFYINATDASHGDLGMISKSDIVLAISYSGETKELLNLLPSIKKMNVSIISITGNHKSSLALASAAHILVEIHKEACPLNLAPTASTTASLAIGDALAATLTECRNFSSKDFAISHPSGSLGKRLLLTVDEIMHVGNRMPRVEPKKMLSEGLVEMSKKSLGMIVIANSKNKVLGIFTDGDLRRALDRKVNVHETTMEDVMSKKFIHSPRGTLAIDAMKLLKKNKITHMIITDDNKILIGALNIHDLLEAGIMR